MERSTNALAELAKELGVVYAVANRGCTRETCVGKVVRKTKCIVAELAKPDRIDGRIAREIMAKCRVIAEEGAGGEDGNPSGRRSRI